MSLLLTFVLGAWACASSAMLVAALVLMLVDQKRRRPTSDEWDLALANAVDLAASAELERSDPTEVVMGCLERAMKGARVSAYLQANFATAALMLIDNRREAWGLAPLDYAMCEYQRIPATARVYRGHPDGFLSETLWEQQLRIAEDHHDAW